MAKCPKCGNQEGIETTSVGMLVDKPTPDTANTATCPKCTYENRADKFGIMQGESAWSTKKPDKPGWWWVKYGIFAAFLTKVEERGDKLFALGVWVKLITPATLWQPIQQPKP